MSDKDDLILDTKRLIGVIGETMAAVSRFLDSADDEDKQDPFFKSKCSLLHDSLEQLGKLLHDSLFDVKHQWNEIAGNVMLMEDLKAYISCCMDFTKQAWEFEDLVQRHWYEADELFGRNDIGLRYLQTILRWEDEAKAIINYLERGKAVGVRLDDVFADAAEKLKPYFRGVSAAALQNFVMNGVSLAGKPEWRMDKCQAVVMGKMLGKSCKEMNDSFTFTNLDKKPVKLNYSQHGPVLEYDQYGVYKIIKEMQEQIEKRRNGKKKSE